MAKTIETVAATDQDAFFVAERRARSPAAHAVMESIRRELAEWEERNGNRQRRRREADQHAHERMIEATICEAIRRRLLM